MSKKLNKKNLKSVKGGAVPEISAPIVSTEDILKDAAEVAIYGAKAGNGVILVTTKKTEKKAKGRIR
ncbi:MAG: hypothetical protein MJ214_04935 [Bacilli bacterium]|nr:hypothetical protein [Bacilli bacterium]